MANTRTLTGYRFVEVQHGDTLQAIAARELRDATRWIDLVTINGLAHPYLTGDPLEASDQVKLYGALILVPASATQGNSPANPDLVYGVDLKLDGGALADLDGDFALVSGRTNLRQALVNRLSTPLGDLLFHLAYGNGAHRLKGAMNGPTAGLLGAEYVRGAMLAEGRINDVESVEATVQGDVVSIVAKVQPITGSAIDLSIAV